MSNSKINLEKKIREVLKEKDVSIRKFCREIGMSTTNLYDVFKRNSIDTKYLNIIEDKYDVSPGFFVVEEDNVKYNITSVISNEQDMVKKFQEDNDQLRKEIEGYKREIELLKSLVESKDMLIKNLQK